ncbi:MAG TPA: ABC transporter permease subunit [Candidatus Hydrogenedentes bacterium]|nr:ABC transporter permease subunit [Candidatus Hydrogenedentota bacterium]HPG67308.1 ABC transporter permease subunit [Candidatus Hydrogenedentota bacterium]
MLRFLSKRILEFVPVLFVICTITFFLIRLAPGGPFDAEKSVTPEVRRNLEAHYHMDAPLAQQYWDYLIRLSHGDLGPSFKKESRSVNEWIALRFPVSLELGAYAILVALGVGLAAGVFASLKPNTWRDHMPMTLAMAGICIPNFVLGPLLVLLFSLQLHWLPVSGWTGPADKILPAFTLGASYAAYIARLSRGGMLEILTKDFIRTARAKGLSERVVVLRHALRGGLQPVVAFLGPALAGLLSGSFVVETIFQVPGLGREFVQAAFNRDYTMIMGTVLFYAALILVFNLLVDLALAWLDPRIRHAH